MKNGLDLYNFQDIRRGIVFTALAAAHQSLGDRSILQGVLAHAKMQALYYDLDTQGILADIKGGLERDDRLVDFIP